MARHYTSLFLVISALLPACSRPVTCALEGCAKNDSVLMANDLNHGSDADAVAAKTDDWTQTIDDVLNRVGAMESLTALLNKTVDLHTERLNNLEKRSDDMEASAKAADVRIAHGEDELKAIHTSLVDLEGRFSEKLEALANQEKMDIAQLKIDIGAKVELFENSLGTLDGDTKKSIKDITDAMALERARVDSADAAVRSDASDNLTKLSVELNKKVETLQGADSDLRRELLLEITRLDGRVDGVVKDGSLLSIALWKELSNLQGQLNTLDKSNSDAQKDLWKEIHSVESRLNAEVIRLNIQDLALFASTIQIRAKQQQTENDLNSLKTRVDQFIAKQEGINTNVDKRLNDLTTEMSNLKQTLEAQIKDSADKVKNILNALLPDLTARVDTIQYKSIPDLLTAVADLKTDLADQGVAYETLDTKVDALNTKFTKDIGDLTILINSINATVTSIKICSISDKYKDNKDWFQDLTCGSTVIKILVK